MNGTPHVMHRNAPTESGAIVIVMDDGGFAEELSGFLRRTALAVERGASDPPSPKQALQSAPEDTPGHRNDRAQAKPSNRDLDRPMEAPSAKSSSMTQDAASTDAPTSSGFLPEEANVPLGMKTESKREEGPDQAASDVAASASASAGPDFGIAGNETAPSGMPGAADSAQPHVSKPSSVSVSIQAGSPLVGANPLGTIS